MLSVTRSDGKQWPCGPGVILARGDEYHGYRRERNSAARTLRNECT
jgi:hypothetical protein